MPDLTWRRLSYASALNRLDIIRGKIAQEQLPLWCGATVQRRNCVLLHPSVRSCCPSLLPQLPDLTRSADILVVAVG